jgi:hypothetical protein
MPWLMTNVEGCCQRLENALGAIWRAGIWKGKGKYLFDAARRRRYLCG